MTVERLPITLSVGTYNAAELLPDCLASAADWVSEILVVDMGSTDATLDIAERFGARVVQVPHAGIVEPGRQTGIDEARQPWVLILDADERAGPRLREFCARTVSRQDITGVALARQNLIFGHFMQYSRHWPDHTMRLLRRDRATWPPTVHGHPTIDGPTELGPVDPKQAIVHLNYRSVSHWVSANNRYTDFEVEAQDRPPSLLRTLLRPPGYFIYLYFVRQGFRDGRAGLAICLLRWFYSLLVELKLWDAHRSRPERPSGP